MATQNETSTGITVSCIPDILDDLPIDKQLALEFFSTVRCANFKQAARALNLPVVGLRRAPGKARGAHRFSCIRL